MENVRSIVEGLIAQLSVPLADVILGTP
jgi:hypothetical protein